MQSWGCGELSCQVPLACTHRAVLWSSGSWSPGEEAQAVSLACSSVHSLYAPGSPQQGSAPLTARARQVLLASYGWQVAHYIGSSWCLRQSGCWCVWAPSLHCSLLQDTVVSVPELHRPGSGCGHSRGALSRRA